MILTCIEDLLKLNDELKNKGLPSKCVTYYKLGKDLMRLVDDGENEKDANDISITECLMNWSEKQDFCFENPLIFSRYNFAIIANHLTDNTSREELKAFIANCITFGTLGEVEGYSNFKFSVINDKLTLTGYVPSHKFCPRRLYLPRFIECIGKKALNNIDIDEVIIPNTILEIDDDAFSDSEIKQVIIPESVTRIGSAAFVRCNSLQKVIINAKIEKIEEATFAACRKLSEVVFNEGLKIIDKSAFEHCAELKTLNLPDSIEKICNRAFVKCGVINLTLPKSLKVLGKLAFSDCNNLKTVRFNNILQVVPYRAFALCSALHAVEFSYDLHAIGKESFKDCESLEVVKVYDKLKIIEAGAFQNTGLCRMIGVENTQLELIGKSAFENCSELEVTIPNTLRCIESSAFAGCDTNKVKLPNKIFSIHNNSSLIYFSVDKETKGGVNSISIYSNEEQGILQSFVGWVLFVSKFSINNYEEDDLEDLY